MACLGCHPAAAVRWILSKDVARLPVLSRADRRMAWSDMKGNQMAHAWFATHVSREGSGVHGSLGLRSFFFFFLFLFWMTAL